MLNTFFPQHSFKALLFDFDGTVADTMPVHLAAWNIALKKYDLSLSREQHMSWAGRPTTQIVHMMNELNKTSINAEQFLQEKEVHYLTSLPQVKPVASVMEIIQHYHGKLPMAIVTGSRRKIVELTMKQLNIHHYFDTLVCAEDYTQGKPAPECFLLAASKVKIAPSDCLAFEDAVLGIESAHAAGMNCLKVSDDYSLIHTR